MSIVRSPSVATALQLEIWRKFAELAAFVQDIVEDGLISSAQLEAVLYANMCFKVFLEGLGMSNHPPVCQHIFTFNMPCQMRAADRTCSLQHASTLAAACMHASMHKPA